MKVRWEISYVIEGKTTVEELCGKDELPVRQQTEVFVCFIRRCEEIVEEVFEETGEIFPFDQQPTLRKVTEEVQAVWPAGGMANLSALPEKVDRVRAAARTR